MEYTLKAVKRTAGGYRTRATGAIPGTMYGAGQEAASIAVDYAEFSKLYRRAGESSLIDIMLDGTDAGKAIVQDIQHDPVSDRIIHVDIKRIDMKKEMVAPVELRFVGESPVVKAQGGTLVTTLHSVEVKCLPKDLVSYLEVDISALTSYDIVIKVKDLPVPAGITIVSPHGEDLIVKASRALTEEEIKAMEAAAAPVDLSQIEVAGKKKEEEEAVEEGAAGAEGAKKEEKTAKGAPAAGAKEEKKK